MGAPSEFPRRVLTVEDFHRMAETGVLRPDERVELIEGELLAMAPIGGRHLSAVNRLNAILVAAVRGEAVVSVQGPVVLRPHSEPQPDFALLRPEFGTPAQLPGPEHVLLAIEISDATLRFDRNVKAPLYARHQIPELWIIDVERRVLLRHLDPSPGGYLTFSTHHPPEVVSALLLPSARVPLADLFAW